MSMKKRLFLMILAIVVFTVLCMWINYKTGSSVAALAPFILAVLIQIYGKWKKRRKRK